MLRRAGMGEQAELQSRTSTVCGVDQVSRCEGSPTHLLCLLSRLIRKRRMIILRSSILPLEHLPHLGRKKALNSKALLGSMGKRLKRCVYIRERLPRLCCYLQHLPDCFLQWLLTICHFKLSQIQRLYSGQRGVKCSCHTHRFCIHPRAGKKSWINHE